MTSQQLWILDHKLTENQKMFVLSRYNERKKSTVLAYVLWFFFGVYYFYLGRPMRNIFLWMTLAVAVGVIWMIVDLFRIPRMVEEYNDKVFTDLVKDAKIVMSEN